ncbi:translation initiation factor IF-2-like [Panicum virgatum]|uniref:translation initiation factor IF-2-like n=1 Tax=Panicum virgatum TaxID=38727 RepID=UPI0019D67708|nr:translation initiation factor IF-2-like [Panicum virgatum]
MGEGVFSGAWPRYGGTGASGAGPRRGGTGAGGARPRRIGNTGAGVAALAGGCSFVSSAAGAIAAARCSGPPSQPARCAARRQDQGGGGRRGSSGRPTPGKPGSSPLGAGDHRAVPGALPRHTPLGSSTLSHASAAAALQGAAAAGIWEPWRCRSGSAPLPLDSRTPTLDPVGGRAAAAGSGDAGKGSSAAHGLAMAARGLVEQGLAGVAQEPAAQGPAGSARGEPRLTRW